MTTRDYTKFLKDGSRLNVRLIPRPVWVEMVLYAQQQDSMIEAVLDEMYWLWDMRQKEAKAAEEQRQVRRGELLQELMEEMTDSDWWKLNSAFEEYILREYAASPETWAVFLDPVYDMQEREGWQNRQ